MTFFPLLLVSVLVVGSLVLSAAGLLILTALLLRDSRGRKIW